MNLINFNLLLSDLLIQLHRKWKISCEITSITYLSLNKKYFFGTNMPYSPVKFSIRIIYFRAGYFGIHLWSHRTKKNNWRIKLINISQLTLKYYPALKMTIRKEILHESFQNCVTLIESWALNFLDNILGV